MVSISRTCVRFMVLAIVAPSHARSLNQSINNSVSQSVGFIGISIVIELDVLVYKSEGAPANPVLLQPYSNFFSGFRCSVCRTNAAVVKEVTRRRTPSEHGAPT